MLSSVHLPSIRSSIHPFIQSSIRHIPSSVHSFIYPSSIHPFIRPFIHLSSIHHIPSFIHPSTHLFIPPTSLPGADGSDLPVSMRCLPTASMKTEERKRKKNTTDSDVCVCVCVVCFWDVCVCVWDPVVVESLGREVLWASRPTTPR